MIDPAEILPIFGMSGDDAFPNLPIQTVSTGTPALMICLKEIEALKKLEL